MMVVEAGDSYKERIRKVRCHPQPQDLVIKDKDNNCNSKLHGHVFAARARRASLGPH